MIGGDPKGRLGNGPTVIELAGGPGAGKTTVLPMVVRAVRERGLDVLEPERAGRTLAARTLPGKVVLGRVGRRLEDRALWAIYVIYATALGVGLAISRPGLMRVLAAQRRRPREAMVSERHVVRWFVRHAGTERLFRRVGGADEVLIVDEGYVHRVVQLFTSTVERADTKDVRRYLAMVPAPELVVFVDAPADVAWTRVQARGVWTRMADLDAAAVARFVGNASEAIAQAMDCVRNDRWLVVRVDNGGDVETLTFDLPADLGAQAGLDE